MGRAAGTKEALQNGEELKHLRRREGAFTRVQVRVVV